MYHVGNANYYADAVVAFHQRAQRRLSDKNFVSSRNIIRYSCFANEVSELVLNSKEKRDLHKIFRRGNEPSYIIWGISPYYIGEQVYLFNYVSVHIIFLRFSIISFRLNCVRLFFSFLFFLQR